MAAAELGGAGAAPRIRTMGQSYLVTALSRLPDKEVATYSEP